MFEVGKRYEIHFIENGDEPTMWRTVERYEHPLVKFADMQPVRVIITGLPEQLPAAAPPTKPIPGEIFNVTSPNFISAVLKND